MPAPASRLSVETGVTLLRCPSCAAAEPVRKADLAAAGLIACGTCGASFPARLLRRAQRGSPRAFGARGGALPERLRARSKREAPLLSLTAVSSGPFPEAAGAASAPPEGRAERDVGVQAAVHPPEPPRRRRPLLVAAAAAAALFLAGFVLGREAATAAVPSLSGLYAAIGLPVMPAGLHVEGLTAERDGASLSLSGRLVNATGKKLSATDLAVEMQDAAGRVTDVTFVPAPAPLLEPDTAADFAYRLDGVPASVASVRVRPSGGRAQPAAGARP